MFSNIQRIQQYFGFATTVILFLATAIGLSSYIQEQFIPTPEAKLSLTDISSRHGKPQIGYNVKRQEYALVNFDLAADLSPLFTWNTKQLFVYLAATYPGRPYANKIVLWDSIITSKEEAVLSLSNERADYTVYDVTGKFNGRNATLSLEWNVQPYVGFLTWNKASGRGKFTFPTANQ
ncbi:putative microsomal signal peptidase subunit 3 [Lipomyces arxii]|uniref:putative microsomal signal peptidase subunit 3 n=1 Tax=Lipomyces arxii TaxID=56418 RepID=UPI0034CFC15D